MGQRLTILFKDNGRNLCSAYYHWSAYSSASALLMLNMLGTRSIEALCPPGTDRKQKLIAALTLLEITGAGIMQYPNDQVEMDATKALGLPESVLRPSNDRNRGLIYLSEKGIEDSVYWAEYPITIDLEKQVVDFGVAYSYKDMQQWKWDWGYDSEDEGDVKAFSEREVQVMNPVNRVPWDFSCLTFDEMRALAVVIVRRVNQQFAQNGYKVNELEEQLLTSVEAALAERGISLHDYLGKADLLLVDGTGAIRVFVE